ncbi:sodium:solute symporter family transporter [Agathobaculum butyriciproducens]|uniref:sodium:solute symporter family transporter n=1 Tax=Agathobaculum butyriciproducens TaxID=1628085 RepID=UPI003AF1C003
MLFTCVTFVFFTILVAVISYVKTKGDDQTTADGYFLAGRGLPGVVIAGSLLLTNLSAEQLVGTNGQTWAIGMSPMAFEVMAATALIVLALFAAPRYLKSGITTIPQLLGERYDRPTKLWFSIAYIILYLFVQIPVILYSGSLVFENIFNLSGILGITKFQSIVILCILITIIGSIYAIFGGLMIPFLALNVLGHASGSESSVAISWTVCATSFITTQTCSTPSLRRRVKHRRFRGRPYSSVWYSSASSPGAPTSRSSSAYSPLKTSRKHRRAHSTARS